MTNQPRLVVVQSHPVQYHAPVWRCVQQDFGINVTVAYGSDFSVAGYADAEFSRSIRWDTDLLSGYDASFLARVAEGAGAMPETVTANGLAEVLQELDPAAVLFTAYRPRFYQDAIRICARFQRPMLLRAETSDEAVKRGWARRCVRDWTLRRLYARFSRLLYIGQNSLRHYRRLGAREEQLIFSPYCVDISTFSTGEEDRATMRPIVRCELGLPPDSTVFLFSGKLVSRKGPALLIEAVRSFAAAERESVAILFLGDGGMRAALTTLSARDPPVTARFVGFQNQTNLSRFYHAADVLVLPSRASETWGLVVNEALIHGLPAVVSDQVGCRDDLIQPGVTGEIFPTNSVSGLAAALRRARVHCGYPEVRLARRERAARYSVRAAASGVAQAVLAVASNTRPS